MLGGRISLATGLILAAVAGIAGPWVAPALAASPAIIDNGTVQLGVNPAGDLNVPGGTPTPDPLIGTTTVVGLRYIPTDYDALSLGCLCEGWGVANADLATGTFGGFAGEALQTGPTQGLVVVDGFVTSTTGKTRAESAGSAYRSIVTAGPDRVRVTHDYRPSASPNLYEIVVAIENIGATAIGDLRYRRVMDWDVQPFAFNEWGEIHVGNAPNLLRATTDGFGSANPLDILAPAVGAPPTTLVPGSLDYFGGPIDQGALFDFAFGSLAPGQTKTFVMYYGAAASRAEALAAITQVGASAYSLGIPRTSLADSSASPTGPNVFVFAYGPNPAPSPPTLAGSAFFGGSGDQRGTAISIRDGAIYASGIVQPQTQSPSDTALVLKYATPLGASPAWSRTVGSGTNFFGIAATTDGVYAGGWNYSLTSDGVGGKEAKSFVARFAPDGSTGPGVGGSLWATGGPGNLGAFFAYDGVESFYGATTALEGGSTFVYAVGGGQPNSYCAYLLAKYGSAGTFVAAATDSTVGISFGSFFLPPGQGCSNASGVTVLNGNVYLAGMSGWSYEDASGRPALWKYDASLTLLGRFKDASLAGSFNGVTALGNALYAVGFTHNPLVSNSEDFLIQKYSEAGALLWSTTSGGASTDVLTGVVAVGSRLFAVGYTRSQGAGGEDAVILEIDPDTGTTLSTTLFGGTQYDRANGVATDGTDLYVIGESRSFASAAGNVVGSNDVMLLRYALGAPTSAPTATALASAANPSDFGQTVTFTATVTSEVAGTPTGTVTFKDGAATLGTGALDATGQATFATSALALGPHSITAEYGGDASFAGSTSAAFIQTVNQAPTMTTVASSANPSVFGQGVTFTATVAPVSPGSGTPTGTVTFKDGDATTLGTGALVGGQATFNTSSLAVGTHSITASYSGDTNFAGSTSAALSQIVQKASQTITVTQPAPPSAVFNASFNVAATASSNLGVAIAATGACSGGGTGSATLTMNSGTGTCTVTFSQAGNDNYDAAPQVQSLTTAQTASQTITVTQDPCASGVHCNGAGSAYGTVFTVAATASSGLPVAITTTGACSGGGSGSATITMTSGTGSCVLHYNQPGDSNYSAAAEITDTIAAEKAATSIQVTSAPNPSAIGQSVTLTATVTSAPGTPTGQAAFFDGVASLGSSNLIAGIAAFSTSTLSQGSHSITATYGGDTNFNGSTSAAVAQTVNPSVSGTIRDTNNNALSGAFVDFMNPTLPPSSPPVATFVTAADGTYSSVSGLPPGTHLVRVRRAGYIVAFFTAPASGLPGLDFTTASTVTLGSTNVVGIDVTLSPGGSIAGTIRDRSTLDAIAGASVFLSRVSANNFSGTFVVQTDTAGGFQLRGLRDGDWIMRAEAAGHIVGFYGGSPDAPAPDNGTAAWITIAGAAAVTGADVHLAPGGGSLSGTVTRSDGGPVPLGTQVQALIGAGSMFPRGNFVTGASTDASGNYTITGLGPGLYTVQALPNPGPNGTAIGWYPAAATSAGSALSVTVTDGAPTPGVNFSVPGFSGGAAPRTISGTVRDASGNPIRFGTVTAVLPAFNFPIRSAPLNGNGTYTIGGLPSGRYIVRAQTETTYQQRLYPDETVVGVGTQVDVTLGNQTGIDLSLPATGATIRGRVTTPGSLLVGVPGVQVAVRNFFDNNVGNAITQMDGTYLIRGVPPGDYKIRMQNGPDTVRTPSGPGFAPRYYTESGAGAAVFDDGSFVHIAPSQALTGIDIVVAPATGRIAGTVTVQGTGAPVIGGSVQVREATSGAIVALAILRADGTFVADNLAPGSYKLLVTAAGHAAQWSFGKDTREAADVIVVAAGPVGNADFAMAPSTAGFSGQAFDTGGQPLRNVGVVLLDAATLGFVTATGVTNSQGQFFAGGLKPDHYYLAQARALGYARVFFGGRPDTDSAALFPIAATSPLDPAPKNFTLARTADISGTISYMGAQTGALRVGLFCDAAFAQPVYTLAVPSPSFPAAYQFSRPGPDTRGLLPSSLACPGSQTYIVGAFVDTNGNDDLDATEPAGAFGGATPAGVEVAEGATVGGRDVTLVENLTAGGTTTLALGVVQTIVPAGGGLATLGNIEIDEHGARALSTAGRIRLTLPANLTFAALPVVSTGVSWGLGIVQTAPNAPQLENDDRTFSFAIGSRSKGGAASIIVSSMLVAVPAGFVPDGASVAVSLAVDASAPNGLTPQAVQVATLLAPPPDPVFIGISLDSNAAGVGVERTVVLNGFNFGQLDFTNSDLSLRDTIDFGAGITIVGTPVVSPDGTKITVTIRVDGGATTGNRTVTIINRGSGGAQTIIVATLPGGGSFAVDPLPVVTAAGTGETGTGPLFADLKKQTLYVGGAFFRPPTTTPSNLVVQVGGGGIVVDPTSVVFLSDTRIAVEVDVAAGADSLSPRTVTVTNPDFGTITSAVILAVEPRPADAPEGLPAPKSSGSSTSTTPPSLSAISPSAARTGAAVTISGSALGGATSTVTFTGPNNAKVTVSPTSGGATSLSVVVPATAVDGPVTVAAGTLQSSNSLAFTVTNPRPSAVSPGSAFQGDTATLDVTGTKFQSGMTVQLSPATGATLGAVVFVDATGVRVPVTLGATAATGLRSLVVTNPDGGTATLANAFEVRLRSASTMTLALKRLDLTPLDIPTWLPSVGSVAVTLDATGRCTAKTVTPTSVIVEAQVTGTPPSSLTFTITPSAIKGTATNEDCEIDPASGAAIPATSPATNDFTIGQLGTTSSLTAPLSLTVSGSISGETGIYQAQLSSWDWGGKVRIEVKDSPTAPTVAGSLSLPQDSDGDDLPDVYENNLVPGVDTTGTTGVNVLDASKQDQNANGVSDRDDRFARDGLTNFEKYRGVYLKGPLNGTANGPMADFGRLGAGKRNLFVRGRGFSTDPNIPAGSCGVDNSGNPVAQDAAVLARFPCPAFEVGTAYAEQGILVRDVAASFTGGSILPVKSYADPTKPTLDMATVTYDAVNCAGGQTCDHAGKTGVRQWQFPTLGYSSFGSATTYGDARVFARAMKGYFTDRPYLHDETLPGKSLPMASTGGIPMLAPITTVCDNVTAGSDNGVADSGECSLTLDGGAVVPGGDRFIPGQFNLSVSAMDVNNDGCVELPFVADPTTLAACNPGAASATGPQATFRQVVRSITTHELGHALGVNVHTSDATDVMYQYSINWTRDNHFSSQVAPLLQVHNKGLQ